MAVARELLGFVWAIARLVAAEAGRQAASGDPAAAAGSASVAA